MRDVFKTQLKAILRAAAFGDIRIMYPMIVSVEEFRKANTILEECKAGAARAKAAVSGKHQHGYHGRNAGGGFYSGGIGEGG